MRVISDSPVVGANSVPSGLLCGGPWWLSLLSTSKAHTRALGLPAAFPEENPSVCQSTRKQSSLQRTPTAFATEATDSHGCHRRPWEMNATAIHSERAMVVLPWDQCCQPLLASTCPRPFIPESQISTPRPLYAHPCFRPWLCGHSACACVSGTADKAATQYPASLIPEPLSLHTCPCSKPWLCGNRHPGS